jgi:hypothetical protein
VRKKKPRSRRMKAPTTRALVNKLDRIFSRFCRMRDADENGTCSCVTCGKLAHWKEMHNGHFIKRQHMAVRFDEHNTHAQCCRCNLYMGGQQDSYGLYILKTYGGDELQRLVAAKHVTKKWARSELEELINSYASRVKEIERVKFTLTN